MSSGSYAGTAGLARPTSWVLATAGVAALAFAAGMALAAVGGAVGPAAMLAPVALLAAAAIFTRPWLTVAAVYLSFPVGFRQITVSGSFGIKLVDVVLAIAMGLLILRRIGAGETPLPWAPQMWWALALLALALVSTPGAVSQGDALKQDVDLAAGFLLALTVLGACRSLAEARKAIGVLLAVGAGLAIYGLKDVSSLRAVFGGAVGVHRAQGVFAQPNDLGAFTAVLLMVALGAAVAARTRRARFLAFGAATISLAALAFSLSRGGWTGTALAAVALFALLPQARRAAMRMFLPLLVLGAILFGVFLPSPPPEVKVVELRFHTLAHPFDNPYDARPSIWREAFREISERPWTGEGPGAFPTASTRSASLAQTVAADHAHDVLLTVAAELGIPAALVLVGFTLAVGLALVRAVRLLPDRSDGAFLAGVAAGLLAQVGQGVVDFNLRNPVIFMLMWSLVGVALVGIRELARAEHAGTPALSARDLVRGR